MLITTEGRNNAAGHAKAMGETTARLKLAQQQHQSLAEAASMAVLPEQTAPLLGVVVIVITGCWFVTVTVPEVAVRVLHDTTAWNTVVWFIPVAV